MTGQQAEQMACQLVGTTEAAIKRLGMIGAMEAMQNILARMGFDETESNALAKVLMSIVAEKGKFSYSSTSNANDGVSVGGVMVANR